MRMKNWQGVLAIAGLLTYSAFMFIREAEAQGPIGPQFTCSADDIAGTLTLLTGCKAPEPGLRRYITTIVAQSTTTTGGQFILRVGTGTNCGTSTASLLPSAATAARLASPANTTAPTVISLSTPIIVPYERDLCVLGVATNTTTIQVVGYVAP